MRKNLILLLVVILKGFVCAWAQPYCEVRTFSLRDGLAANVISDIAQTSDDLMWFGTWNGLAYFDGYRFTTYRDAPGPGEILSSNRILTVEPNSRGDVWITTYDRSLYLFDTHTCQYVSIEKLLEPKMRRKVAFRWIFPLKNGYSWVTEDGDKKTSFRIKDDDVEGNDGIKVLTGFNLQSAAVDSFGREWLMTDGGLRDADGRVFARMNATFMVSGKDRTWFVSTDGQMISIGKGEKSFRQENAGLSAGVRINDVHLWKGSLLIATTQGLWQFSPGNGHQLLTGNVSIGSKEIKKIFVDSRNRVWLFTSAEGIVMTDGVSATTLQANAASPLELTQSVDPFIHEDEHGIIWTVPTGGTFSYYDETTHTLVPNPLRADGFSMGCIPLIKKYYVDSQHNLWITGNRDLTLLNFRMRHISRMKTVEGQEVRAICVAHNGDIWVGDAAGALMVFDANYRLKGYMTPSGQIQQARVRFSPRVYCIYQDKHGRMWIGGKHSGLYCIDRGTVRHFTHNPADKFSLCHDDIYDISEDTQGHLWVAAYEHGLNLIDESNGSARFINVYNQLRQFPKDSYQRIRRITTTKHGVVILSTNGGLITFSDRFTNPENIHFYKTTHVVGDSTSLASSDVFQTLVARSGKIYVNTMAGYMQEIASADLLADDLKLHTIEAVTTDEGLVQSMVEDSDGNIWLARETTIDKYSPRTNSVAVYGAMDMGGRVEMSEAEPRLNPHDGRILIGGGGCFLSLSPRGLVKNSFMPKIMFTTVQFQGESKAQSILNTEEFEVPSDKRSLTIFFSALDYSDNQQVRYAYMLKGYDDKWTYVGSEHSAALSHIPHGHLRLLVRSTNADGVWQDNTRELKIYVHPTFWESWMGWLLYIIIGGGLLYLGFYVYNQRQHIRLQKRMQDMMTEFFTNIGHKLRTPLTLIGGPVTEVMRTEKLSDRGHELLDMVHRNSVSMLSLVNKMLDYDHNPDNYLVDDLNAPAVSTPQDIASGHVSEDSSSATDAPSHPDTKLLVVEDTSDLRQFLFTILSSDYSVITAVNGKDGLEKARQMMPDFIITDVMMPVMDGLTMVHELKRDKNTSHIPIIILSAKASMQDRLQGLHEGVDDYITKPFSATYLKERVANIIARRRSLQQEVLAELSSLSAQPVKTTEPNEPAMPNEPPDSASKQEYRLSSPEIIDEDKVMMEKLMAYLEQHIDDSELRMEDMAQAVNLGRTVFYGKMKSIVGMAPIEFVRHIRLQRAEELVVKSKMSFSQIAYAVGFTDPKYFSKCFKKETGMSPSEYRSKGDTSA